MNVNLLKKIYFEPNGFIERKLPRPGTLVVKKGDTINSYDKLGDTKIIKDSQTVSYKGRVLVREGQRVYPGDSISEEKKFLVKKDYIKSTISGVVKEIDKEKKIVNIEGLSTTFTLYSGISGEVVDVLENTSVLIKSQSVVIKSVEGTGGEVAGELVYLKDDKLTDEDITESVRGKIIVANSMDTGAVSKAKTMGAFGFVLASCEYVEYKKYIDEKISVLVIEGFGKMMFSIPLLNYFKKMDSKFGAIRTYEGMLIMPGENLEDFLSKPSKNYLEQQLQDGDIVQLFNKEHFGQSGVVKKVKEKTVLVEVDGNSVELSPNVLGIIA